MMLIRYLELGFELRLYAGIEYSMIYWYLDYLVSLCQVYMVSGMCAWSRVCRSLIIHPNASSPSLYLMAFL